MSLNFSQYDEKLLFVPLGGSNEIGMNFNLYRHKGKWLIIDCGIGFADDYLPGVDIVLPKIDAITEFKDDIVGMIITHAHEDHHGGVAYLYEELQCPIYATSFTAAMLKPKFAEMGLKGAVKVNEVEAGKPYDIGPFKLEMVPLTHSIPEMHAIAIKTQCGTVIHTGDWKLDHEPLVGPTSDEDALTKYGDEGVLAMVCDSTNVFVDGESGSESMVRTHLQEVIKQCEQRAIVTTFASNIARLESIVYAGMAAGRQIALAGKSLWRVSEAARECGYLKDVPPFLTDRQAMDLPRDECMIICTGCQGEGRAALTKMARGDHPAIRLNPEDTVIFSSRVIPGNEMKINYVLNQLVLKGIEVINEYSAHIHVSGHPCRDELERMYQWVRPQIAVPVHGEARHLHEHTHFAKKMQVPETIEVTNGAVALLEQGSAKVVGHVDSGYLAMDGSSLIDTNSSIIRSRRKMRDEGVMFVSIMLGKEGKLRKPVKISAPGVMDEKEDKELVADLCDELGEVIEAQKASEASQRIEEVVRATIRRFLRNEIGKKPVIHIHLYRL